MASSLQLGALAGLLGGFGGFGQQVGQANEFARTEALKQQQLAIEQQRADQLMEFQRNRLAQEQKQFEATQADKYVPADQLSTLMQMLGIKGAAGAEVPAAGLKIPATALPALLTRAAEQEKVAREQAVLGRQADVLEAQGAGRPGTPAIEPPVEGAMYSEGTPATPGVPANERLLTAAKLYRAGGAIPPMLEKILGLDPESTKLMTVAEGATVFDPKTRQYIPSPNAGPAAMPPPTPGTTRSITFGGSGQAKSYTDKPIEATNLRDALAQSAQFGGLARYEDAPPDVKRAIIAEEQRMLVARGAAGAQARQGIELAGPIGKEAENFTDPKTLEPARAGLPKQYVYDNYLPVPQKAVQSYKTIGQTLAEAEDVITRRPDLFPPTSKNYAGDVFRVGGAMAQYWATKKTDPDVRIMEGLQATLPLQVRTFGDTGNIAVAEREIASAASGLQGPSTQEAALSSIQLMRRLVSESGTGAGLPALDTLPRKAVGNPRAPSPGPAMGRPDYTGVITQSDMPQGAAGSGKVWIKAPDGVWGKWDARKPIPQGYSR